MSNSSYTIGENCFKLSQMINHDVNMCTWSGILAATILTRVMGLRFFPYIEYRRGKSCVITPPTLLQGIALNFHR